MPRLILPSGRFYIFGAPGLLTALPTPLTATGLQTWGTTFTRNADMMTAIITVY
jgi:hypothetical protein